MPCVTCSSHAGEDYPFCPECGKLSPSLVSRGAFSLELEQVPSEKIRNEVVAAIRSWFPQVDPIQAEKQLSSGSSVLISGIDEASVNRILDALRPYKAPGRLSRGGGETSWFKRLWNPGLVVFPVALILGLLIGGITGIVLVLTGLGAIPVGALLKHRRLTPIVPVVAAGSREELERLADQYSLVVTRLSTADAEILRSLTASVFEFQRRLKSGSVASVAAGAESGGLHERLTEAIRTAVEIGGKMGAAEDEERDRLRKELAELKDLVTETTDWYRHVEGEGIKQPHELADELGRITASIDRIVQDVRSPLDEHHRGGEKDLL